MTTSVAIAGVGELPQGRSTLPNTMALHERLVTLALRAGMRVRVRFEAALDPAVRVPVFELEG